MAPEAAGCIVNGAIHSNTSLARAVNAYDSETFRLAAVLRLTVGVSAIPRPFVLGRLHWRPGVQRQSPDRFDYLNRQV